jgi:hypothetical protein
VYTSVYYFSGGDRVRIQSVFLQYARLLADSPCVFADFFQLLLPPSEDEAHLAFSVRFLGYSCVCNAGAALQHTAGSIYLFPVSFVVKYAPKTSDTS